MSLSPQEYMGSDATELARQVAEGNTTPAELLEVAIAQYHRLNPQLNAVCQPMFEIARERTRQSLSGPLAGVPILIKDAIQDYAGLPTGSGSKVFSRIPVRQHSHIVQRLLNAGAVIMGKSNTPELALKGVTDPEAFGHSRNPWNVAHTTGGSSGGSAAAVASVMVPMAGANDGGGCAALCATPHWLWMCWPAPIAATPLS